LKLLGPARSSNNAQYASLPDDIFWYFDKKASAAAEVTGLATSFYSAKFLDRQLGDPGASGD
jgi:hypothetical protein